MTTNPRILFVDDDPMIRNAFKRTIRSTGFELDLATGGEEAVELAAENHYAVVATDYTMPGANGFDVVSDIRLLQPHSTFVLISANCDLALTLDAVNEYAMDFVVPKPWGMHDLVSTLNRALERYWERATVQRLMREKLHTSGVAVGK